MGHAIEEIALQRDHEVVCKVGIENLEDRTAENIKKADVVIEFTGPDSAFDNVKLCEYIFRGEQKARRADERPTGI